MIKIIENCLSDSILDRTKTLIEDPSVPWHFLPGSTSETSASDYLNYSFQHTPYMSGKVMSNYFEISNTIGLILKDKFELKGYYIDRLRWGLVTSIGKLFKNSPHIDTKVPHKTILFYPHDSDGETYFYNDKHEVTESVIPKMNRAVLFDGSVLHSSSKPIQTARRIVLNVNLIHEETKI